MELTATGFFLTCRWVNDYELPKDYRGPQEASIPTEVTDGQCEAARLYDTKIAMQKMAANMAQGESSCLVV